jgi:hypothetical protein
MFLLENSRLSYGIFRGGASIGIPCKMVRGRCLVFAAGVSCPRRDALLDNEPFEVWAAYYILDARNPQWRSESSTQKSEVVFLATFVKGIFNMFYICVCVPNMNSDKTKTL